MAVLIRIIVVLKELRLKASAAVHDMEEHKSLWEAYTKTQAKLSQRVTIIVL
jgi:uncharacterized ferritin-like protein (DUF455 family)